MRTQVIEIYPFQELETAIQKKIVDTFRYRFLPGDWADYRVNEWTNRLQAMGFQQAHIRFSVSASQGDGASFTASRIDLPTLEPYMEQAHLRLSEQELAWNNYGFGIQRINHRYFHEKSVSVTLCEQAEPLPAEEKGIAHLIDKLFTKIHSLSVELHRELFKTYYSHFQDSYVQSEIISAQMEFYKNGLLYIPT